MVQRILKRAEESEVKRADDNEATIRTRIETFVKNTDEILVQYPSQTRRVSTPRSEFAKFKPPFSNLSFNINICRSTVNVQLTKFLPTL